MAAEAVSAPAIILVAATAFRRPSGKRLAGAFLAASRFVTTEVMVELDHESDIQVVREAIALGMDAAMVDGSRLSNAENGTLVSCAREALGASAGIEAELGRVEGDEDVDFSSLSGSLTNPDQVANFAERSGCDTLAVSIGNVHGTYHRPPKLDIRRLRTIAAMSPIPLSLHGASGLSNDELRQVIAAGVTKINFNTELRRELFRCLAASTDARLPGLDVLGLMTDVTASMQAVVSEKLDALGWGSP
jgi:tagatose 1,6-diphosphate aldolase GatY/KbaY